MMNNITQILFVSLQNKNCINNFKLMTILRRSYNIYNFNEELFDDAY